MNKRKHTTQAATLPKRAYQNNIQHFWATHYMVHKQFQRVKGKDVYSLFKILYPITTASNFADFNRETCRNRDINCKRDKNGKIAYYYAVPVSEAAKTHHQDFAAIHNQPDFHLANIQGLISNRLNKNRTLNTVTTSQNSSKIIALTETHLTPQHYNAEILKSFPNYNIIRTDRDTEYDLDDEYQLLSHGGCLLLTSADIIVVPRVLFSNGNCELIIAESPELAKAVIIIYRPPKQNFSLQTFSEILTKVRHYLNQKVNSNSNLSVIMSGDFNFPLRIVNWVKSEDGIFAGWKHR